MDLFLERRRLRACPVLGVAVVSKERARHGIHALVGALRRENGGGEQLEGIGEAELDARGGIGPRQPGQYLCRARLLRLR